jgi:hypothetical protein
MSFEKKLLWDVSCEKTKSHLVWVVVNYEKVVVSWEPVSCFFHKFDMNFQWCNFEIYLGTYAYVEKQLVFTYRDHKKCNFENMKF